MAGALIVTAEIAPRDFSWIEGLRHVALEAGGEGALPIRRPGVGGQRNRGRMHAAWGQPRAYALHKGVPIFAGHADIAEKDVDRLFR